MRILEKLYNGTIHHDMEYINEDSYITELVNLSEINKRNLFAHLNEKEKETFEKFNAAQNEMNDIIQYENFSYGFRLGISLMAEAFTSID